MTPVFLTAAAVLLNAALLHFNPPLDPGSGSRWLLVEAQRQDGRYRKTADGREHSMAVFEAVRTGLISGDVGSFAKHFAGQVQINLRGGESGYFSAHQAFYLLENYLRACRLTDLSFSTIGGTDAAPYATGGAAFACKGGREYVQVYVALTQSGDHWVISRLNIY